MLFISYSSFSEEIPTFFHHRTNSHPHKLIEMTSSYKTHRKNLNIHFNWEQQNYRSVLLSQSVKISSKSTNSCPY
jgi:hypothetical protein